MTTLTVSLVAAALASSALLAVQDLPDGEGKAIVASRCAACHGLDRITSRKLDRDAWTAVVAKMVENGAQVDDAERRVAIEYLTTRFGPPPADPEVQRTARRYIDGICSSCHAADIIAATQANKNGWLDIVNKMNGKGAGLSEADVELLADYLARLYPEK